MGATFGRDHYQCDSLLCIWGKTENYNTAQNHGNFRQCIVRSRIHFCGIQIYTILGFTCQFTKFCMCELFNMNNSCCCCCCKLRSVGSVMIGSLCYLLLPQGATHGTASTLQADEGPCCCPRELHMALLRHCKLMNGQLCELNSPLSADVPCTHPTGQVCTLTSL